MPQHPENEPIDLDVFNMDAEAIGQQAVDTWDLSDPPTPDNNRPSSHPVLASNNNSIDGTYLGPREKTQ